MVRAKKHRLPPDRYVGEINLAITARLLRSRGGFTDPIIVERFVEALDAHALNCQCRVPIYCFMPDHLHMIVQGTTPDSRSKEAVDEFKKTTSLWLARNSPHIRWQHSYFDHIIRGCEDWREQAR